MDGMYLQTYLLWDVHGFRGFSENPTKIWAERQKQLIQGQTYILLLGQIVSFWWLPGLFRKEVLWHLKKQS